MPRHRVWGDTNISIVLAPGIEQQIDLNLAGPVGDTLTVVRIIGRLHAFPNDQSAQVTGAMKADYAIGVSAAPAFALGVTATPDVRLPAEVPPRGWLFKGQLLTMKDHSSGTTNEHTHVDMDKWDVRAARKLDRGIVYVKFNANTSNGGTTFDVRLTGTIRTLFLT